MLSVVKLGVIVLIVLAPNVSIDKEVAAIIKEGSTLIIVHKSK